MKNLFKLNLVANIGVLITVLSGLVGVIYKWPDIAEFTTRMHMIYEQAPSMERLIKDFEIIHGILDNDKAYRERQKQKIDSLEMVVDILTYGKAPYQDTIWYMNEYGQWIKCNIRNHPLLNEND